jgi:hypothetical protein
MSHINLFLLSTQALLECTVPSKKKNPTWLIPTHYFKIHIYFPWDTFTANWLKITIPVVPYSFHETYKHIAQRGQTHKAQGKTEGFDQPFS